MKNIPWMRFKGNWFNVIFNNALVLLQIKYNIIQYLENTKSSLNFIQSYILSCLKNPLFLAMCYVLGNIYISITRPYMTLASQKYLTAFDMGHLYQNLVYRFEIWSTDINSLLCGEDRFCLKDEDILIQENTVLKRYS